MFVWADAISIDQRSDKRALRERSAQVLLMRRIFSEAEQVVVELGTFPVDDKILVDGFLKLNNVDQGLFEKTMSEAEKD